jgi:hypothetical protein
MKTISKPQYVFVFLLIAFCIGLSSGLLWTNAGTQPFGFFDASKSIKASVLPLGEDRFIDVTKDNEKFNYKLRKEYVELNISKKNVLYVVDLNGKELEEIQLKDGFDFEKTQFIFAGTNKLYFFEGKNVNGQFIPRR